MGDSDSDYGLVMPFVTVASKGGPHDDDSYCCGYEMGTLDATLGNLAALAGDSTTTGITIRRTIHTANRTQADLIAMRHGYRCAWGDPADPEVSVEWVSVTFARGNASDR